ncbi:hypothetical protein PIB30_039058 [Stylosanthes scabra]|uniref:Myb/SANT-like domain-containing protein n=1 Tax=Stylosanthes scabra TaxID=79078 RepID=A0ABU6TE10_9FABA|nr:hypothetical protein [Stylosanthes scabra]
MIQTFSNCTLTAKHCRNKHKRMKEKYQYTVDMLACNGFGWNDEKQCVEVDSREVLEAWMKANPKKFYTLGKPFPVFQRLGRIGYLGRIGLLDQPLLAALTLRNKWMKRLMRKR